MENLIGKKIKGFKFEDEDYVGWVGNLEKFIGKIGLITSRNEKDGNYYVDFDGDNNWKYPSSKIQTYLVDEWVVGEEYEFSDLGINWFKGKLLSIVDHDAKYIASVSHMNFPIGYKQIRHIQRQIKEVTIEEIAKKFGVSVESIKIKK